MSRRSMCVPVIVLAAFACDRDRVSDTGYVGTWSRGNAMNTSTVMISRDGESYRFRWRTDSVDGKWKIRCDWDGNCEERFDGEKVAEHHFEIWEDPASGHLMIECNGKAFKPIEAEIHYVDELVLEEDGLRLWSYTLERGDESYRDRPRDARPRVVLTKVSDRVAEPPRATQP